jgi:hypothetical protein
LVFSGVRGFFEGSFFRWGWEGFRVQGTGDSGQESGRFFRGQILKIARFLRIVLGFWVLGEMSAVRYQMSARKGPHLLFADFPLADI